MEPMPKTMKLARRMVTEIEVLNKIMLGPESWEIIKKYIAAIDEHYLQLLEKAEQRYAHEGGIPQVMTTDILKRWVAAIDVPIMTDIFQTAAPNVFYATFALRLEPGHYTQLKALNVEVVDTNGPLRNRYMLKWQTPPNDEV